MIYVLHIPISLLVMALTGVLVALTEIAPGPGQVPAGVAMIGVVALTVGGTGAALVSVISGPAQHSDNWTLLPPETQGMRLAFRTAWPPAIAVIGASLPLLVARHLFEQGQAPEPGATAAAGGVLALFVLIAAWVRLREDIGLFLKAQMDLAIPPKDTTADAQS